MSTSTLKIDFTKLSESETREVLSHIQEYENTCEREIRAIENTTIASNVLRSVAAGAVGAFSLSILDKVVNDNDVPPLEKTILTVAGAVETCLCSILIVDGISKSAKVLIDRKKRNARTKILNADTKAELGIGKILIKKQEENAKNKKK